jgi:hypothetical protein
VGWCTSLNFLSCREVGQKKEVGEYIIYIYVHIIHTVNSSFPDTLFSLVFGSRELQAKGSES